VLTLHRRIFTQRQQEDEKRKLTELGRVQAELTGTRLREMIDAVMVSSSTHNKSNNDDDAAEVAATFSCRVTALRVSDLTRAKETANIIASFLPLEDGGSSDHDVNGGLVAYHPPDPYLNEGRPCHHIPGVRATPKVIEVTDDNHKRIEEAFQRYFYRADPPAAALPVDEHPQRDSGGSEASSPADVPPSSLSSTEGPGNESLRQQPVMGASSTDQQPPASSTAAAAAAAATHPVQEHHEFEIIVCHANVIRYFVCRCAFQRLEYDV
jgi:broad specificity phosphatase PhoE